MQPVCLHGQFDPFSKSNEPQSAHAPISLILAHNFFDDPDSEVKMPKIFVDVRQELDYAAGWPPRPVRPILKVKQAGKRAYPPFRRFSCAIANHFLGDPNSDVKNAKKNLWTSVKTLVMHLVDPHDNVLYILSKIL